VTPARTKCRLPSRSLSEDREINRRHNEWSDPDRHAKTEREVEDVSGFSNRKVRPTTTPMITVTA
jgi:hypothetical protein